mgnify:CR=1 FL=1
MDEDNFVAPSNVNLPSPDSHHWVTHDLLIAHVVQNGRHVVLVDKVLDHGQIVTVDLAEKEDVVQNEACPRKLKLCHQERGIYDHGATPQHYGSH